MKTSNICLALFGVLILFGLAPQPARAGEVNCTFAGRGKCGSFGKIQDLTGGFLSGKNGKEDASFVETVWFDSKTDIYTYVFTIINAPKRKHFKPDSLSSADTLTLPGKDNFDLGSPYQWGVITSLTDISAKHAQFDTDTSGGTSFLNVCFDYSSKKGCLNSLKPSDIFAFYVQSSEGPAAGDFQLLGSNEDSSLDPKSDPKSASEPGVPLMLASLLVVLLLAMPIRARLRQRAV
jgi:hypothetical protein